MNTVSTTNTTFYPTGKTDPYFEIVQRDNIADRTPYYTMTLVSERFGRVPMDLVRLSREEYLAFLEPDHVILPLITDGLYEVFKRGIRTGRLQVVEEILTLVEQDQQSLEEK